MKINLITIGKKLPNWVNKGFQTYADRLPKDLVLNLIEVPALKRSKNANIRNIIFQESQVLLKAIPKDGEIIALDRTGEEISTQILSQKIIKWRDKGKTINLLVGGPEGLVPICFQKANWVWSLTQLTLPYALVRIVIAEQIYRAWSIISNHPYHRY